MIDEYLVSIHRPHFLDGLYLYIAERHNRELYVAKPMELVFERLERGTPKQATLTLPTFMAEPLLRAFADMLHHEQIKPTQQSFIEGELVATKKHLEDMRMFVLKNPLTAAPKPARE